VHIMPLKVDGTFFGTFRDPRAAPDKNDATKKGGTSQGTQD
jgi:hypothetical protein